MNCHGNSCSACTLSYFLFPLTLCSSSSTFRATTHVGYSCMAYIQVNIYILHLIRNHFIQVELCIRSDCGPTMSLDVAEMICSMPSLKEVSLQDAAFHHCFFETLARTGKESKVSSSFTIVICV